MSPAFAKVLSERGTIRVLLLSYPAAFKIVPTFFGLLAIVNCRITEIQPKLEDRQGLYPVKIITGIIPDGLRFDSVCGIVPLTAIVIGTGGDGQFFAFFSSPTQDKYAMRMPDS